MTSKLAKTRTTSHCLKMAKFNTETRFTIILISKMAVNLMSSFLSIPCKMISQTPYRKFMKIRVLLWILEDRPYPHFSTSSVPWLCTLADNVRCDCNSGIGALPVLRSSTGAWPLCLPYQPPELPLLPDKQSDLDWWCVVSSMHNNPSLARTPSARSAGHIDNM